MRFNFSCFGYPLAALTFALSPKTAPSALVAPLEDAVAKPAQISLTSPADYQVFQRRTRLRGEIKIAGHVRFHAEWVRARASGRSSLAGNADQSWRRIRLNPKSGRFRGSLPGPAGGFYKVEVEALDHGQSVADTVVENVGIGEVFVVAGQSNATNYGEVRQHTETRMVTAFDGAWWQIADDPQPGVQDNSQNGSFIPSFGDALYRKYNVPIGIADVGHGSTSIRQWLPAGDQVYVMPTMGKYVVRTESGSLVSDGSLFNGLMRRTDELGKKGFRALLWHQGESDANQPEGHQITPEQYRTMLAHVIVESRRQAGWKIPWFVAEATYHNPDDTSCPPIREAQRSLWEKRLALQGPDTDTLGRAFRQNRGRGVHFNDEGLKKHGLLWADRVMPWLDQQLK